ncbi:MAG: lysylphosphatidylglycerol synthase transmembrane domain-containing protein [Sandaracinaceae bacterium]|nr:lysylphosphatidylglycerol synthase transmembrane domain-containing protein [Sandaracinaceae bacterium]
MLLRVIITACALAWVVGRIDGKALLDSLGRASPLAFAMAVLLTAMNLVVGSIRWRILLRAYGAPHLVPLSSLVRLNYVGFFYNTCLPGGVGGDLVRGYASRRAFGEGGLASAGAVVLVDRVLGLVGLLLVVAGTSMTFPLPFAEEHHVMLGASLGIVAGFAAIAGIGAGRALAPWLPLPLRRIAERLPRIVIPGAFAWAVALSIVTQSVVALTGHLIASSIAPIIRLRDSMVVVPIAMATTFLPFLLSGTGAREEVFVRLYGPLGVSPSDALASSLLVWLSQVVVALIGGLLPAKEIQSRGESHQISLSKDLVEEPSSPASAVKAHR